MGGAVGRRQDVVLVCSWRGEMAIPFDPAVHRRCRGASAPHEPETASRSTPARMTRCWRPSKETSGRLWGGAWRDSNSAAEAVPDAPSTMPPWTVSSQLLKLSIPLGAAGPGHVVLATRTELDRVRAPDVHPDSVGRQIEGHGNPKRRQCVVEAKQVQIVASEEAGRPPTPARRRRDAVPSWLTTRGSGDGSSGAAMFARMITSPRPPRPVQPRRRVHPPALQAAAGVPDRQQVSAVEGDRGPTAGAESDSRTGGVSSSGAIRRGSTRVDTSPTEESDQATKKLLPSKVTAAFFSATSGLVGDDEAFAVQRRTVAGANPPRPDGDGIGW